MKETSTQILIVDDNVELVDSLKKLLGYEGFSTTCAFNGIEALTIPEHTSIDLILLDIMMPGLNEISTLMKLREQFKLPVIILSAKTEESDKIYGLVNELNRLMRLTLTVSDSFVNPYAPSHPYNEVLETMNKVNEEKKKAVEEGIQHERTKVELITNISHDLKTPLTAITNYVEFLSKESLNQTSRDYVEVISNKVKKTK